MGACRPFQGHYPEGKTTNILWNVAETGCGSAPVLVQNRATEYRKIVKPDKGYSGYQKADYADNLDLFHTMEAYFTWYPNGRDA